MAAARGDFPAKVIAELLGITPRRLQQLANDGFVPRSDRGQYPLIGSVQGYIRYLKQASRESNRSSEHQRLARAQAVKVEMENYRRAGEYVLREHVYELLTTLNTALKGAHEGIPGRTANEFAATDDAAYIRKRQQEELRTVRRLLADTLEEFSQSLEDSEDHGADDAPAEKPDAEPVGERVEDSPAE